MAKKRNRKILGVATFIWRPILILLIMVSIVIYFNMRANKRLQTCPRFTLASVTHISKMTFKSSELIYEYYYNGEQVVNSGSPDFKDYNDWLKRTDTDLERDWVGRRVWVQFSCEFPQTHDVL